MIVSDETAERVKEQDSSAVEVPVLDDVENLVVRLTPSAPVVPGAGMTEQARRNAELRWHILHEYDFLDAAGVAELSGSRSVNNRARASRWAGEGRIFGVSVNGRMLYPAFQFDDDGQPRRAVAAVIETLKTLDLSPWATVIWWDTRHDTLAWRRPADVIGDDSEAVLAAAQLDARTLGR